MVVSIDILSYLAIGRDKVSRPPVNTRQYHSHHTIRKEKSVKHIGHNNFPINMAGLIDDLRRNILKINI